MEVTGSMKTIGLGITLVLLFVVSVFPAFGQSGFDFDNGADGAVMLNDVETVDIGGAVNVRSVPTADGNTPLFTANSDYIAELVAEYVYEDGSTWNLGRFFNRYGHYVGFGWFSRTVANVTTHTSSNPVLLTPSCSLTTGGRQADIPVLFNDGWVWDAESTQCNVLAEGRALDATNDTHHYWAVRDRHWLAGTGSYANDAQITQYVDNGVVTALEGTVWLYPPRWNMSDLRADDAAIVLEFAAQKRAGGAEYPLRLHDLRGSSRLITEALLAGVNPQDTDNFDGLELINVTGVRGEEGRMTASVGAADQCWLFIGQRDSDEALEVQRRCGLVERFVFYDAPDMPDMFWVIPDQNTFNNAVQQEAAADLATLALGTYIVDYYGINEDVPVQTYGFGSHLRSGEYSVGF